MIDPVVALTLFSLVAVVLAFIFWPSKGLYWRWRRVHRKGELVDVEDVLKHVYDCEYLGRTGTVESVAGALAISATRAFELVHKLHSLGLLITAEGSLHLTPNGRSWALRVIRIHRLWERYLADRTGLHETQWHSFADRWEHTTSPEEAEALSARLGSPRYDPHGDPIPTIHGEIPATRGQRLTSLSIGQSARITHVEDEPEAIYAQLVAEGIHPGMVVRLIEQSPSHIRLETAGEELVLAPIVAANVTAIPLQKEANGSESTRQRLSDLKVSEIGKVVRISRACRGPQARRLLDLGLVPGTVVEAELVSPAGDLTAYRIRGALIALRKDQAQLVHVTRMQKENPTA
jgi:DtxR family Mn-dependent transcriptional regulator